MKEIFFITGFILTVGTVLIIEKTLHKNTSNTNR